MAALLERFYEPQGGAIMLDGQGLSELDPSWLRGQVLGYISQEPVLFGCSVMENIRYGNLVATDQQVKDAAKLAHADQFIENFPNGYSTLVGERGVALSGGQKQRSVLVTRCTCVLQGVGNQVYMCLQGVGNQVYMCPTGCW